MAIKLHGAFKPFTTGNVRQNTSADRKSVQWITNAGSVGTANGGDIIDVLLRAQEVNGVGQPTGGNIIYTVASGTLPAGTSLSFDGHISGTLTNVASQTLSTFTIRATNNTGQYADRVFTYTVNNTPLVWVTDADLGQHSERSLYNQYLQTTGVASRTYQFRSGTLPAGISFINTTGQLTGTFPHITTTTDTYTFTIRVQDNVAFLDREFTLAITNTGPVWSTSPTLGTFAGGQSYNQVLVATDPEGGPLTYAVQSGTVPPGLTYNTTTSRLSGTFTNPSSNSVNYSFTVRATDEDGVNFTDRTFSTTVTNVPVTWSTPAAGSLGTFEVGSSVNQQFVINSVDGTKSYSVVSGSLPASTSLSSNGFLTGTVTANVATYNFTIRGTDGKTSADRAFSMAVVVGTPVWTTAGGSLGTITGGSSYSYTVMASDPNNLPLTYSIISGALPDGLSLNSSTGEISGTATEPASNTTSYFTIRADNGTKHADRSFSLTVNVVGITWNTPAGLIASIHRGVYSTQLSANAATTLTYSLIGGSLPSGLTLSTSGLISGNAAQISSPASTYNFSVRASTGSSFADRSFALEVVNDAPYYTTANASSLGSYAGGFFNTTGAYFTDFDDDVSVLTVGLASGSLPTGMSLSKSGNAAIISGTSPNPASDYTRTFTLSVYDGVQYGYSTYSITITNYPVVWVTPAAGSIGTYNLGQTVNVAFTAQFVGTINYAVQSGTLPSGLTLNSTSGYLTGTLNGTAQSYSFTLRASDGLTFADRSFSLTSINTTPVWSTAAGSLGSFTAGQANSVQLVATDSYYSGLTYSVVSGSLPSGFTLNSSTGLISGTPNNVASNATSNFTVRVTNGFNSADRAFSMTVLAVPMTWGQSGSIGTYPGRSTVSYLLNANALNNISYTVLSGSLPGGLSLVYNATTFRTTLTGTLTQIGTTSQTFNFTLRANDGLTTVDNAFSLTETNSAPVWVTAAGSLGTFNGGSSVSTSVVATDPEGDTVTYALANSTTLPSGLTLSSSGAITGTTTNPASNTVTNFTVAASDGVSTTTRSFSLQINNVPTTWTTASGSLGNFQTNSAVSYQLVATPPTQTYTVTAGSLPPGLTLSSSGLISGTTTLVTGVYTFTVQATDGLTSASRSFSMVVDNFLPYWTTPSGSLGSYLAGSTYNITLAATDPRGGALTYSIVSGSLPTGYSLNSSTGVISGAYANNVTAAGLTFNFTVRATNGDGYSVDNALSITIAQVAVTWSSPTAGSMGSFGELTAISPITVVATGGINTISYSVVSGSLPSGLSLNGTTGVISGTPSHILSTSQVFSFTIRAADGTATADRDFSITISNQAPIWNNSGFLGAYPGGGFASVTLNASDPEGRSLTYSLASGTIPTGLTLNANGVINGTAYYPNSDTTFNFTVNATDGGASANAAFSMTIAYTNQPPTWNTPTGTVASVAEGDYINTILSASDDSGSVTYSYAPAVLGSFMPTFAGGTGLPDSMFLDANSGTLAGIISNAANANAPIWNTNAGLIGTYSKNATGTITLSASPTGTLTITDYSVVSGVLPLGTVLFGNGVVSVLSADLWPKDYGETTVLQPIPVFNTNAGTLGAFNEGATLNLSISATAQRGNAISSYQMMSGALPWGISMNPNTGAITGTIDETNPADTVLGLNDTFTWSANAGQLAVYNEGASANISFTARPVSGNTLVSADIISGQVPYGLTTVTNTVTNTITISGTVGEILDTTSEAFIQLAPIPAWTTTAGSLGAWNEGASVSRNLSATAQLGTSVTSYEILSGALPWGLTLSNTGTISGTVDEMNPADPAIVYPQTFPTFNTAAGLIGTFNEGNAVSLQIAVTPSSGNTLAAFDVISGQLPYGLTVSTNTITNVATISGTISDIMDSTEAPVPFTPVPTWTTAAGSLGTFSENTAVSTSVVASPNLGTSITSYEILSGALPWGLTFANTGAITGTIDEQNPADNTNVVTNPTWVTTAGSLGTFNEGDSVSVSVTATPSVGSMSFDLVGSTGLPLGLTYSVTGNTMTISGTMGEDILGNGAYIAASSGPVWTSPTSYTNGIVGQNFTGTFVATPPSGQTILYYHVVSGSLPFGVILTPTTGAFAGAWQANAASNPAIAGNPYSFQATIRATASDYTYSDQTVTFSANTIYIVSASSGTFVTPTYSNSVVVEVWGGGGAGAGYNTTNVLTSGATGTQTSFFGPSTVQAGGGLGGSNGGQAGGSATGGDVNTQGNTGGTGVTGTSGAGANGVAGVATSAGVGGASRTTSGAGNFGGVPGAGGGGAMGTTTSFAANGGGSGGYARKTYTTGQLPSASYTFNVGAGAAGAGTQAAGGGGGAGALRITWS